MERFEELQQEEQISIIIGQFSGHERMDEVADIFATITAYKVNGKEYLKKYAGLTVNEIRKSINDEILNINTENQLEEEEKAWETILNTLGYEKVFEVLDDWMNYVGKYVRIEQQIEEIREVLYKNFI